VNVTVASRWVYFALAFAVDGLFVYRTIEYRNIDEYFRYSERVHGHGRNHGVSGYTISFYLIAGDVF
jgi:hypothetical protein